MMPPKLPGSSEVAETAATPTTLQLTKLTTSRSSNNNNNNSNNNLTHFKTTETKTTRRNTENRKELPQTSISFHKRRRRRQQANTFTMPTRRWRNLTDLSIMLLISTASSVACVAAAAAAEASSAAVTASSASSVTASPTSSIVPTSFSSSSSSSSPCAPHHWWDAMQDKCIPCTSCQGEMIPLRPCQLHTDTICGSIYDLKIDWVVLAKTEPNWKERRKSSSSSEYEHFEQSQSHKLAQSTLQHLTHEQLQQLHDEAAAAWALDWQTSIFYIAVLTCLIFFTVAAGILIHHMRQWRRMERRLDQDVEELSTKLMAKLAEVQSLDGGTFFIGNADALRGLPATAAVAAAQGGGTTMPGHHHHHHHRHFLHSSTGLPSGGVGIFQPQHVLLPDKHHGKHHQQERRILKTLQPGNVYIEENNKG
ncbi:tumor necrosis factor receptor superfamily member wengen isoform X1 [Drosophila tropicalis]|uniref:tumor necrosis factor receptor superfamily member wengen isoform X1 n=1 Tax=Drosophila tropicalis TaxID=46794 RepID=UPI0035ABE3C5